MISENSKNMLMGTVKEWNKFLADKSKLEAVVSEVAFYTKIVIAEQLQFLKTQNVEIEAESTDAMAILGVPIQIIPVIEATYPNVKGSVHLKCGGAMRTIIINPNMSISAGGTPVLLDQLRKAVPDSFAVNAAEFLRDGFLNSARTGGKE